MVDVMASDKKQTRYAAEKEAKATQGMTAAAENHETWLGARKLKAVLINSITAVGSLFQIWDINGDGTISKDEFQQAVNALDIRVSQKACDKVFDEFDPDGSGTVSYTEFLRFALRDALAKSSTRVMDLFKGIDSDGSGEVNAEEFRKAVKSLGFEVPRDLCDSVFDTMDADKSGSLSFKELNRQLRQGASITLGKKLRVGGERIRVSATERNRPSELDPEYHPPPGSTRRRPSNPEVLGPFKVPTELPKMSVEQMDALMQPSESPVAFATQPASLTRTTSVFAMPGGGRVGRLSVHTAEQLEVGQRAATAIGSPRAFACPTLIGGGGAPRPHHQNFAGFAKNGFVVCDERRRNSIMDQRMAIARQRIRGPPLVYKQKRLSGFYGAPWREELPAIDRTTGLPFITTSTFKMKY
jgi:Ca2+-binding EF-hand superfamily protein